MVEGPDVSLGIGQTPRSKTKLAVVFAQLLLLEHRFIDDCQQTYSLRQVGGRRWRLWVALARNSLSEGPDVSLGIGQTPRSKTKLAVVFAQLLLLEHRFIDDCQQTYSLRQVGGRRCRLWVALARNPLSKLTSYTTQELLSFIPLSCLLCSHTAHTPFASITKPPWSCPHRVRRTPCLLCARSRIAL